MKHSLFKSFISLTFLCFYFSFYLIAQEVAILNLDKNWQFKSLDADDYLNAQVPGSVQLNLLNNNKIEDPFYRSNEKKVQWIGEKDWEYRLTFQVDPSILNMDNIILNFEGLDTYAQVFLNGKMILNTENYFFSYEVNVKNQLKQKANNLRIVFFSPIKKTEKDWNQMRYELPGGPRVLSRKPQFHFGWDWGPRIVTIGPSGPIQIKAWNQLRIEDIHVRQLQILDEIARLEAEVQFHSNQSSTYEMEIWNENEKLNSIPIKSNKGKNKVRIPYSILDPILWWPHTMGTPHLYTFEIKIKKGESQLASQQIKIGLRTIKLIQEKDDQGKSFYITVNGIPTFMKGANYIPMDILQGRISDQHYKDLLNDVVKSNMNMLRVWGGGQYEKEIFYSLCDELGILVWQDFMFACAMYPGDKSFLNNVKKEAEFNIKRLRNHPSIALWCGNNENSEGWHRWGWQKVFKPKQNKRVWGDYQAVFQKMLPSLVEAHTVDGIYWESSPKYGRGNPKHQFEGDAHYWGVWHDAEPFEMFEKKVPRFMSEFGFQSFPSMSTIQKFALPEDYDLKSEVMNVHQKHPRGNKLIKEYMSRDFPVPNAFEDFVYMSQVVQAYGMRKGMEAHRRNRPYCMGTLYWQLNDCWPVASWSSRDYYGEWKALQYATKEVFKPIILSVVEDKDSIHIYGISDQLSNQDLTLIIDQGQTTKDSSVIENLVYQPLTILPNTSKKYLSFSTSNWWDKTNKNQHFLRLQLYNEATNNVVDQQLFFPVKHNQVIRIDPEISIEVSNHITHASIKLKSKYLAQQVMLTSNIAGHFSDNFFDLVPGEIKEISFIPKVDSDSKDELIISLKHIGEMGKD